MNFELLAKDWNIVSEVGLPPDGEFVIVIFGNDDRGYDWQCGGYSEENHNFYVNLGLGGLVLDEKDAVAWVSWDSVSLRKTEE